MSQRNLSIWPVTKNIVDDNVSKKSVDMAGDKKIADDDVSKKSVNMAGDKKIVDDDVSMKMVDMTCEKNIVENNKQENDYVENCEQNPTKHQTSLQKEEGANKTEDQMNDIDQMKSKLNDMGAFISANAIHSETVNVENHREKLEEDEIWNQITKTANETSIKNQAVEKNPDTLRNATAIPQLNNKDSTSYGASVV